MDRKRKSTKSTGQHKAQGKSKSKNKGKGRPRKTRRVAAEQDDCTVRLPDELWHMILNGTDGRGRAFLHPFERPLVRAVCSRWRAIVERPGAAATKGHLERVWRITALDRDNDSIRQTFMAGRILTIATVALFLRGDPRWSRALLLRHYTGGASYGTRDAKPRSDSLSSSPSLPPDDGVHDGDDHDDIESDSVGDGQGADESAAAAAVGGSRSMLFSYVSIKKRIAAFYECMGEPEREPDHDIITAAARHLVGQTNSLGRTVRARMALVTHVPRTFVVMGDVDHALEFLVRNLERRVVDSWRTLKLTRSVIYHGASHPDPRQRDNVDRFLGALTLVTHASMMTNTSKNMVRQALRVWSALAATGSVECIRALVQILGGTETAETLQRTQAAAARFPNTTPLSREHHPRVCSWLSGARTTYANCVVNASNRHWTWAARDSDHLLAVIEAHGMHQDDVERAMFEAVLCRDYARATAILDFARAGMRPPYGLHTNVEFVPALIARAASVPREAVAWAVREGYKPEARHLQCMMDKAWSALYTNDGRALYAKPTITTWYASHWSAPTFDYALSVELLAEAWPAQLMDAPDIVRNALWYMLSDGRWSDVAKTIEKLALAVGSYMDDAHRDPCGKPKDGVDRSAEAGDTPQVDQSLMREAGSGRPQKCNIWNKMATGTLRYTRPDFVPEDYFRRDRTVSRALLLAKLADYCDAAINPETAHAWRFWCSTPKPIELDLKESALIRLFQRGLCCPSTKPDA